MIRILAHTLDALGYALQALAETLHRGADYREGRPW
jgi:hypothetical protein